MRVDSVRLLLLLLLLLVALQHFQLLQLVGCSWLLRLLLMLMPWIYAAP